MTPFQILRVAHLLPGAWIISRRSSMDEWEKNYRVLQRYSRKAIKAFGFELHVQGAEDLPTQGPLFFVSNHQGTLDPAPIVASCPIPLAFISKKENESIPLLGRWAQLIGTIHFDRDTKETYPLQEQLQETEKLLDDWEIVGTSAGEAVVVYMNAKKIINGIELDESIVDPTDVEMLEDLIMAAINDGYSKADKVYEEKMGKYGNMGSLGGMI